jgi:hypothetical protein
MKQQVKDEDITLAKRFPMVSLPISKTCPMIPNN